MLKEPLSSQADSAPENPAPKVASAQEKSTHQASGDPKRSTHQADTAQKAALRIQTQRGLCKRPHSGRNPTHAENRRARREKPLLSRGPRKLPSAASCSGVARYASSALKG